VGGGGVPPDFLAGVLEVEGGFFLCGSFGGVGFGGEGLGLESFCGGVRLENLVWGVTRPKGGW